MLTVVPAVLGYPDAVRGHSAKNIVTIYTESEPRKFHWERMTYKQNKNTYHFLDSSVFAHFYSTRNHRSTSRGTMFCARVNEANVPTTAKKTRFWMTHQTAHGLTEQRHRGKKKITSMVSLGLITATSRLNPIIISICLCWAVANGPFLAMPSTFLTCLSRIFDTISSSNTPSHFVLTSEFTQILEQT